METGKEYKFGLELLNQFLEPFSCVDLIKNDFKITPSPNRIDYDLGFINFIYKFNVPKTYNFSLEYQKTQIFEKKNFKVLAKTPDFLTSEILFKQKNPVMNNNTITIVPKDLYGNPILQKVLISKVCENNLSDLSDIIYENNIYKINFTPKKVGFWDLDLLLENEPWKKLFLQNVPDIPCFESLKIIFPNIMKSNEEFSIQVILKDQYENPIQISKDLIDEYHIKLYDSERNYTINNIISLKYKTNGKKILTFESQKWKKDYEISIV